MAGKKKSVEKNRISKMINEGDLVGLKRQLEQYESDLKQIKKSIRAGAASKQKPRGRKTTEK